MKPEALIEGAINVHNGLFSLLPVRAETPPKLAYIVTLRGSTASLGRKMAASKALLNCLDVIFQQSTSPT